MALGLLLLARNQLAAAEVNPIISAGTNKNRTTPANPFPLPGPPTGSSPGQGLPLPSPSSSSRPIISPYLLNSLSQDQVVAGLREALQKGVQQAVLELGHENGFFTNLQVRIPMPQKLLAVERTLRSFGQDQLADQFIATMNRAAEQAVPQATAVFVDAIQHMTIADAKGILTGPEDSATQYFRRVTETNLNARFLPIVKAATDQAGVTSTYKRLLAALNENKYLGPFSSALFNNAQMDIDAYVTDRALDGLFKMVAREEVRIRRDPVARTSEILQRVFGVLTRG